MDTYTIKHKAERPLKGSRKNGIVGVVASGNCEALFERVLPSDEVVVEIATAVTGFADVWGLVVASFVERASPGGARISINDGGATPDVVTLRLLQGAAMMERA
jgi:malonate decarboxylase delta subunit